MQRICATQGAEIMAIATMPPGLSRLYKRQGLPLIDEDDIEWAGDISIGRPAQSFLIDFDSTSIRDASLCAFSGVASEINSWIFRPLGSIVGL
jgi:hypothetical protein